MFKSLLSEVQYEVTVPCVADRVVMTAAVVVLGAIFEVDMPAEQHGYRANLSAHTAVRSVHGLICAGHTQVIEGDLAGYFDSIPHAELLKSVGRSQVALKDMDGAGTAFSNLKTVPAMSPRVLRLWNLYADTLGP
jgi:hypothetical protein